MNLSNETQQRISILRVLMIFGIVVLHTPLYVPLSELGNDWFDLVKAFFQSAVFRTTVPVLTAISGFLLFHAGGDRNWRALLKKKCRTLLVPFLVFNLTILCGAYLAERYAGLELSEKLVGADRITWLNAAFGLMDSPINYPSGFLRDLIVLMALAPLFGYCLRRRPLAGLALVSAFFMLDLDGPLVLRNAMPLTFYLGGMAAICKWDLKVLDRFAPACIGLFFLACAAVIAFRITNLTCLRLISVFLVWPFTATLVDTAIGKWLADQSKYSFFVFIAHAPLLAVSWVLYRRYLPGFPYQLYWILTPLIVTGMLVVLYQQAMRLAPGLFSFILGRKPVGKERKGASFVAAPVVQDPTLWTTASRVGPAD
jgi:succinoglycan biosynthesis protein ExoH